MIKKVKWADKRQISCYPSIEQISIIDKEALENDLTRSKLLQKMLDHHYPINDTTEKEEQKQNGTGTIERDNEHRDTGDELRGDELYGL
jgi:hypothetical protein